MLSSGLDSLSATCLQILSAFLLGLGYDYFCTFMNIINTSTVFIQCLFFYSTQFQEFDFLQPTTATTSAVATTSHTQLQTAHWTVAGQMLWDGLHTGFEFFSDFFYVFSSICWDVRWSQENSIEHNKELAAALRWTGDSNVAMSFIGCGPQHPKTVSSVTDSRMQYSRQ